MYCPVCGGKAEKIIDYMGAKVCPECGCVIEVPVNGVTSKSKREIDLLKVVKILSIISIIFIFIICYLLFHSTDIINYFNNIFKK